MTREEPYALIVLCEFRLAWSAFSLDQWWCGRLCAHDLGNDLRVARGHVNHVDTAAFYLSPLRSANELINSALAPYQRDLVITTKVGPGRDPSGDWFEATPQQLRGQVEENLRQLGRDHLDVVNLRIMRRLKEDSFVERFAALAQLRHSADELARI
jgi:aryl-alcohol dehydrogenase-like predicted oxidoreductase